MEPPVLDLVMEQLSTHPEVHRVFLFGSRARGDAGPRSDIDLAVEAPGAGRRAWLDIAALIGGAETLLPIQVARLDTASAALRKRIFEEGVLLYDRSKGTPEPAQSR